MRAFGAILVTGLLLSGCYFMGDSIAARTVSVKLPSSASKAEVDSALAIVDSVLVSRGFVCDTNVLAPVDKAQGIVAFYGICSVSFKDDRLDISFVKRYQRHSSAVVKTMCLELQKKMSTRYGVESVEVDGAVQNINVG